MVAAQQFAQVDSLAGSYAFLIANAFEILGTATGVTGALLLALNCRFSAWAWPIWILSNMAWIAWALSINSWGILIQQGVFLIINCIGTWKWTAASIRSSKKLRLLPVQSS